MVQNIPEFSGVSVSSWAHIHTLAERVGAGDRAAWPELMAQLEPKLQVLVRYQKIGRLRSREDDLRNVVVAVFEKLERRDFEALRRFAGMHGRPSFEAWIRRVVRSVAIDYLRGHAEYRRSGGPAGATTSTDRWVSLHTLTTGAAVADPDSAAAKRRQVMDALAETVDACAAIRDGGDDVDAVAARLGIAPLHVRRAADRGHRMQDVVALLLSGHRHQEIAERLGLTRREVEVAIDHVEALLVARWRQGEPDEPDDLPDRTD